MSQRQKQQRVKRGGGAFIDSLDEIIAAHGEASYVQEISHAKTPEHLFQRAWAEALLTRVLERLEAECAGRGDNRFGALRPFLASGSEPPALSEAAAALELSISTFK